MEEEKTMYGFIRKESTHLQEEADYHETILAGDGWMYLLKKGHVLRIVDSKGNQAVDAMFYDAADPENHYSATKTIAQQQNIYLTTGSILYAENGKPMLEIVADLTGRHDTLAGSCSNYYNTVRYGRDLLYMHNCKDTFMLEFSKRNDGVFLKRDLAPNVNFFMNVPITPDGVLEFADGISRAGNYVELQAKMDVQVLISNCPQLMNPCNDFNPTPIEVFIFKEDIESEDIK